MLKLSRFKNISLSDSEDENSQFEITNSTTISTIVRKKIYVGWEGVFFKSRSILDKISEKIEEFEEDKTYRVVPDKCNIFKIFDLVPLDKIKVVILMMDPYQNVYSDGIPMGTGIASATEIGRPVQPTLKNMYKEIKNSYPEFAIPNHGDLTKWCEQGVFMLNYSLTTKEGISGAHSKILLWEGFMINVMEAISETNPDCIYLLLGKDAQKLKKHIGGKKSTIETSHPSPFSANRGFLGSNCFKEINTRLVSLKPPKEQIVWDL